jgi:hypothetical protein
MRLVAAATLIATGLLVACVSSSRIAVADPETCPPVCDKIPDTAWISPSPIPLNSTYHWPSPAGSAVPLTGAATPRFRFEEVCATPALPQDTRNSAVAARSTADQPRGQWQLRAEVVHWRGDTTRGCQLGAATESPSVTVDEPDRLSAVVSGPVIMHTYLVAHPENSTLSELTLWASDPVQLPWPIISDAQVLDAMASPLCTAYLGSC